jgi:hypothetical protein
MSSSKDRRSPVEKLIDAAEHFKYWLDIQPPGTLFYSGGGDVRASEAYQDASRLLSEAAAQLIQSSKGPREVLLFAVSIGDLITEDCADMPSSLDDIAGKIGKILPAFGIEVGNDGADGTKHCRFLKLRLGSDS